MSTIENDTQQTIVEWFNPHNKEHLKGYKHLLYEGVFPDRFLPDDVIICDNWLAGIQAKMADCWLYLIVPFDE